LKCCINYEKDSYKEALHDFPPGMNLETDGGTAYFMKIDVFRQLVWYSFNKNQPENVTSVKIGRVFEIIEMNKSGKKPDKLTDNTHSPREKIDYEDLVGQESINRFDKQKHKKKKKKHKKDNNTNT
jgi:cell fate regulator YaaT (PSP1 superfamily)